MNVRDWQICKQPRVMVRLLEKHPHRRLRLVGIAWCRQFEFLLNQTRCRELIGALEQCHSPAQTPSIEPDLPRQCLDELERVACLTESDFDSTSHQLRNKLVTVARLVDVLRDDPRNEWHPQRILALDEAIGAIFEACSIAALFPLDRILEHLVNALYLARGGDESQLYESLVAVRSDDSATICKIIRDIFPHHQSLDEFGFAKEWLTPAVWGLADEIYTEKRFEHMPILGDALEDAGCDKGSILEHCRRDSTHYRGCWVIDSILGKV